MTKQITNEHVSILESSVQGSRRFNSALSLLKLAGKAVSIKPVFTKVAPHTHRWVSNSVSVL